VPEIIERVLAALIVIVLLGIVLYLGGVRLPQPTPPQDLPPPARTDPAPRPDRTEPAPQSRYKYQYKESYEESLDASGGDWYVAPSRSRDRTYNVDDDPDQSPRYHRYDCNGGDCSCTCDQSAPYWARTSNYCPD
jgi:hypothetical protein